MVGLVGRRALYTVVHTVRSCVGLWGRRVFSRQVASLYCPQGVCFRFHIHLYLYSVLHAMAFLLHTCRKPLTVVEYIHARAHTHTHTHAYIYTCIHTYMHTSCWTVAHMSVGLHITGASTQDIFYAQNASRGRK